MVQNTIPKAVPGDTTSIAARYERARQLQEEKAGGKVAEKQKSPMAILNEIKKDRFGMEVWWVLGVWTWFL